MIGCERRHPLNVAVKRLDVENEHWRIEVGARSLLVDQMVMQFTVGRHANKVSR